MSKNDLIRMEFLEKYQAVRGGFHFAMDDDTDELICIWNFQDWPVAHAWISAVADKFNLQYSNEVTHCWRLWW